VPTDFNVHAAASHSATVNTGADRLLTDAPDLIRKKSVGVLTNHTGRLRTGQSIVDAIADSGICRLAALFGPEHGIGGDTPDGEVVDHGTHRTYDLPIYSLYGKMHKPTAAMLKGVDVLVCDIQDVGARFYTFISTIALALEAAAENGVTFVVLDRPNPIRGLCFDGPIREQSLKTFVAWMPLPVTHGMTIGELTRMWNQEGQLANGVRANLEVLAMDGWKRSMWFDETGLPWLPPSPNMPRLSTAILYPGMCFLEGTSIAEGRGTDSPFELVGAPWADPEKIIECLKEFGIPGVALKPEEFTPCAIKGIASEPKYEGQRCNGIRISIVERDKVEPVKLGIAVVAAFKRCHPRETDLRHRRFDILTGSQEIRRMLEDNAHPNDICSNWSSSLERFSAIRQKYLIYQA
jgi:uncharacterized protein YbbC (DUF1343 family)